MSELLLGVDFGTASSKAVLVAPDGRVVARAARPHAVSLPRPGWVEHDPESAWWGDLVALCRELLPGRAGAVRAVGVSGIGPCVCPCDADDRPLRPAILYGVDTRAQAEVDELTERLGEQAILARCGSTLSSQALGPKLLWLARNEPDVWARTRRWHMASTLAVARLTGAWALDHASASQCDPLYDVHACRWHEPWAAEAAPGLSLPPLAWPGEVVGEVTARAAAETGLPAGTPVVAGTVDAWAEALSAGVRRPGDLMVMYGSALFMIAVRADAGEEPTAWTTRGVDPGVYCTAAGLLSSGSVTAWLRELFGSPPFEQLVAEAAAAPPGASGLLLLPSFQGERTPVRDARARGALLGLTLAHGRGEVYRAALEGVALGIRRILDATGVARERVVAVGGGTRGGVWPQIVSDVCGIAQELPAEGVGASLGDARLAAEAAGLAAPGGSWAEAAAAVEPRPALAPLYDELYAAYRGAQAAARPLHHALAALGERAPAAGRTLGG